MRRTACWLLTVLFAAASQPASLRAREATAPFSSTPQSSAQDAEPPGEVPSGTRFLVGLKKGLNTKSARAGDHFATRTLEPLVAPDGTLVPVGSELRGHVSRVEAGGATGRARIWLSFDDIDTPMGAQPIVAEVTQVPGEHSVKPGENKEGEIEARTSAGQREMEAALAGAALGVSAAAAKGGSKGAAIGAATGALAGFLTASGIGQELDLMEGTKLELELLRPLVLTRR
jgi:hypothetical protein